MAVHPEIELVSRDRGGDYASAAATGAPQAVQCADRFHILKNLGEALEGLLARHLAAHRRGGFEQSSATPLSTAHANQPPKLSPKAAELSRTKRGERLACYQQVVALRKQGFSQTAIADRVGVGHATVSRWLAHDAFPEQQPRPRKTGLDAYLPLLRERWDAGCHNIAQLYRELVARGYTQSYASVYEQLVRLLPEGKKNAAQGCDLAPTPLSSRQAMFLFLRRSEDLETDEQKPSSRCATCIQKSTWPTISFSSLPRCCAPGQGTSLMPGLSKSERAGSARCRASLLAWNETKRRSKLA